MGKKVRTIKDILLEWEFDPERAKSKKYVQHEFQDFGIRLAFKLNDIAHKALYIKLAKTAKRDTLEEAYRFACDYPGMEGKNRGKLFMFAFAKLRKGENLRFPEKKKTYMQKHG
jgi:hypothetical protein